MNYRRRESRALELIVGVLLALPNGLASAASSHPGGDSPKKAETQPTVKPLPTASGQMTQEAAIEQLSREIEAQLDRVSPHPKRRFITSSTQVPEYREYMHKLVEKIERTAKDHYPYNARGLSGRAIVTMSIGADGALLGTIVNQSSGHKELDDAAVAIVKLAAPFERLPEVDGVEILDVTRTFQFSAVPTSASPPPSGAVNESDCCLVA